MHTILVPLDGSAHAERILPYVASLAQILGASVRLLRVLPDARQVALADEQSPISNCVNGQLATRETTMRHANGVSSQHPEDYLAVLAMHLRDTGVEVDTAVSLGSLPDRILEHADREPETLIALTTHDYGGLRRWALGSVTDQVIQASTTPIFVVRADATAPHGKLTFKRILVPLDDSQLARQALPLAMALAQGTRAELLLLRAVEPRTDYPALLDAQRARTAKALGAIASSLRRHAVPVTSMVGIGRAAGVIVTWAAHCHADLIVMATHGYGGFRRWALGSVADCVLHTTMTPLLLVPTKNRAV